MIQRGFHGSERAEAERFSEPQFHQQVHSLHDPGVVLLPRPAPVQDQLTVLPQTPGHFLHRLQPAPHRLAAPIASALLSPNQSSPFPLMAERIHGRDCRRQGRSKIPEGPCTHGDRDFVRTRTLDGGNLDRHRRQQREGGAYARFVAGTLSSSGFLAVSPPADSSLRRKSLKIHPRILPKSLK